jgi:hypothetical protein
MIIEHFAQPDPGFFKNVLCRNPLTAHVKNEKDQEFSFNIEQEKHSETM